MKLRLGTYGQIKLQRPWLGSNRAEAGTSIQTKWRRRGK